MEVIKINRIKHNHKYNKVKTLLLTILTVTCSNHGNQKLSILKELSVWPNNCKRLKWSRQQRTNRTGRHTNTGINTDIPRLGWGPYQCLFGVQYLV